MPAGDITLLLRRMATESGAARKVTYDAVMELVYDELRRKARGFLRHERADSLQPTALVHAVYERLLQDKMSYADRQHFYSMAATAMRRILIERARRLSALRRGARPVVDPITADTPAVAVLADPDLLLAIDQAMAVLTPEQVRLTELRYYVGLTIEEAAEVMELNVETAKKRWRVIKALLLDELEGWTKNRT